MLALAGVLDPPLFLTGCEDARVRVYHSDSLTLVKTLQGEHRHGISAMRFSNGYLFSASRNVVCVWDARRDFALVASLAAQPRMGHVLSVCPIRNWVLLGSQSTRILASQWRGGTTVKAEPAVPSRHAKRKAADITPDTNGTTHDSAGTEAAADGGAAAKAEARQQVGKWTLYSAHHGYVYCLAVSHPHPGRAATLLFSGGGDGVVHVWHPAVAAPATAAAAGTTADEQGSLARVGTLAGHTGTVFALLVIGQELWSCSQDKTVRVWDIDTLHCRRVLEAHQDEVLCLCSAGQATQPGGVPPIVCSGSADHTLRLWDSHTCILLHVIPHPGIVLAVSSAGNLVYTSCKRGLVKAWDATALVAELATGTEAAAPGPRKFTLTPHTAATAGVGAAAATSKAALLSTLRQFVAFPSVSSEERHRSACWRCAKFVQGVFARFSADCRLVQVRNVPPCVCCVCECESRAEVSSQCRLPLRVCCRR